MRARGRRRPSSSFIGCSLILIIDTIICLLLQCQDSGGAITILTPGDHPTTGVLQGFPTHVADDCDDEDDHHDHHLSPSSPSAASSTPSWVVTLRGGEEAEDDEEDDGDDDDESPAAAPEASATDDEDKEEDDDDEAYETDNDADDEGDGDDEQAVDAQEEDEDEDGEVEPDEAVTTSAAGDDEDNDDEGDDGDQVKGEGGKEKEDDLGESTATAEGVKEEEEDEEVATLSDDDAAEATEDEESPSTAIEEVSEEKMDESTPAAEGDAEAGQGGQKRKNSRKRRRLLPPPPPEELPSPAEEALMRSAAGRMTLSLLLVQRELLKAYLPQIYKPVAFLVRYMRRETSLLIMMGLAPNPLLDRQRRLGPRRRSGLPPSLLDEDSEDEDQLLSAEALMPAPVDRFRRVSATFLTRHDLIDESLEEGVVGQAAGRDGAHDDGRGGERKGPSFTISFSPYKHGVTSSAIGRSPATRLMERKKLQDQQGSDSKAWFKELQSQKSSGPFQGMSLPEIDLGLSEGAKAFSKSMQSLTKGLSNLASGKKSNKSKTPKRRRVLFTDDEDDDGDDALGRGADPIGLPSRKKVIAAEEKEATTASSSSSRVGGSSSTTVKAEERTSKRKKVSLLAAIEGDDDEEDDGEDGHGDWLASLKRRGSRSQPTMTGLAQRRRKGQAASRSLFDDDDDDRAGRPSSSSSASPPAARDRPQRFVKSVDDVTSGRFPGVDNSEAKERIEELRKRTSMSYSVRRGGRKEDDDD